VKEHRQLLPLSVSTAMAENLSPNIRIVVLFYSRHTSYRQLLQVSYAISLLCSFDYEIGEKKFYKSFLCYPHKSRHKVEKIARVEAIIAI
jgi:hypothetical protein